MILSGDRAQFSRTSQFTLLSFTLPDLSTENSLSSYGNALCTITIMMTLYYCIGNHTIAKVKVGEVDIKIVTRKSSSFVNALPPLLLNDVCLECVSSFKYLGVILCSNLSWSPHIKSVYSKSRKVLGVITRCAYAQGRVKRLSPSIYIYVCVCVGKKHGCLLSYRSKIATK